MVEVIDPIQKIIDDVKGDTVLERCQYRLNQLTKAKTKYYMADYELSKKKARLRLETKWGDVLPHISRPTLDDKEVWITIQCYDDIRKVSALLTEMKLYKELYELEKNTKEEE